MEFGAIARTCHAHPTLSEAVKEAARSSGKQDVIMIAAAVALGYYCDSGGPNRMVALTKLLSAPQKIQRVAEITTGPHT